MTAPTPSVSPELKVLMRQLRLGRLTDTLPERLALARTHSLTHMQFLEQLFSDEVQRRDTDSAGRRARSAHLDGHMVLEAWDDSAAVTFDKAVWSELVSLRFIDEARNAFILGPVGVGKTFLLTALGHIACRRRIGVHFERADRMLKRLKASRLDASYDAEMRKLIGVPLLLLDDFALHPLDATETSDFYELVVERHHRASTLLSSNRDPVKAHTFERRCARRHLKFTRSCPGRSYREGRSSRRRSRTQRDLRRSCRVSRRRPSGRGSSQDR
jgi:DNA replication protein DnaC